MTPIALVQSELFASTIERPAAARTAALGLIARVWHALANERQRRQEAEIAHLIRQSGGRLTDGLERDIERYFHRSH